MLATTSNLLAHPKARAMAERLINHPIFRGFFTGSPPAIVSSIVRRPSPSPLPLSRPRPLIRGQIPNPFFDQQAKDTPWSSKDLFVADGGIANEIVPVWPLLQHMRHVDVIIALDAVRPFPPFHSSGKAEQKSGVKTDDGDGCEFFLCSGMLQSEGLMRGADSQGSALKTAYEKSLRPEYKYLNPMPPWVFLPPALCLLASLSLSVLAADDPKASLRSPSPPTQPSSAATAPTPRRS